MDKSLTQVLDLPRGWHAHRPQPGAKWQRSAIPSGPTHLLICEAIPSSGIADATVYAGAFVQCWIRCRLKADARRYATKLMARARWKPVTEMEHHIVRKDTLRRIHRRYFEQVQFDGEVMVFATYPPQFQTSPPNNGLQRTRR